MGENNFQKFDNQEDQKREILLKRQLKEERELYEKITKKGIDEEIHAITRIINILKIMKLEAIDIDESLYDRMKKELQYLKHRKTYIETYSVEEVDIKEFRKEQDLKKSRLNNESTEKEKREETR